MPLVGFLTPALKLKRDAMKDGKNVNTIFESMKKRKSGIKNKHIL